MKLLALVTLYYPPAHITDNLLTYAEDVDGLFVWDNTPGGSNYQFPESISHKIVRLRQGENTGIGKALNAAAMFALDNGYTYLRTALLPLPHSKTISVLSTMTKTVPILLIFLSSMLLAQTAMRRSKKHRG